MKVAVLTDSASNLSEAFIKEHKNLFVVPLMIVVDGKEYRDQLEISASEVYKKLDAHEVKTSLPALTDLNETLATIKKDGYTHLVVINISSGLSGTFNSFRLALEEVKDLKISHFDTKTLGGGEGFIVEYALELIEKNTAFSKILPLLKELRNKDSMAYYTINTLKYLREGGRIGKVEGTIGDLLHIKPVITVNEEGVYVTLSKAFGLKRSLLKMKSILIDEYKDDLIDLIIHFGNNEDKAKELAEKLKPVLNIRNLKLVRLTPVLGVHTGPEIIAYIVRRIK
ncbi:MAG: DegV family protein [Tenericutes bacterium]|jgi:DegV family protein with EDD domain|nr:DegV family protein [Mycoplasmatota bacterium]